MDLGAFHGAAAVHHQHVIGGACDHAHVVGNHDAGSAGLTLRLLDHFQNLSLDGYVEGCGGFVGNKHLRVIRNCDCDHHTLTHTAREFVREGTQALLRLGDTHQVEQLRGTVHRLRLRDVRVRLDGFHQLRADVVHRGQSGQRILEDHADAVATNLRHCGIRLAQELLALKLHRTGDLGVIRQQAHDSERGDGLAGT